MKNTTHDVILYYRCCYINEAVIFSDCVHLKLGYWFHALLKVYSDRDDTVPLNKEGLFLIILIKILIISIALQLKGNIVSNALVLIFFF